MPSVHPKNLNPIAPYNSDSGLQSKIGQPKYIFEFLPHFNYQKTICPFLGLRPVAAKWKKATF
jgi:hypothetical protein